MTPKTPIRGQLSGIGLSFSSNNQLYNTVASMQQCPLWSHIMMATEYGQTVCAAECTLTTLLIKTLHHTDIHVSLCALTFTCTFSSFRLCETVVPLEDPIITETTSTLQEWGVLWKQLYVVSSTISQHISLILNKKTTTTAQQ